MGNFITTPAVGELGARAATPTLHTVYETIYETMTPDLHARKKPKLNGSSSVRTDSNSKENIKGWVKSFLIALLVFVAVMVLTFIVVKITTRRRRQREMAARHLDVENGPHVIRGGAERHYTQPMVEQPTVDQTTAHQPKVGQPKVGQPKVEG